MPGPAPDAATASVPTIHAQGGGGSGAGAGGKKGKKGKGKRKAKKGKGKQGAPGGKKNGSGKKGCGDPVCPITGKMFLDIFDFGFAGPFPLVWTRHYQTNASGRTGELGFGWTHPYAWRVQLERRSAVVIDDLGREQEFDEAIGTEPVANGFAWTLCREGDGLALRKPDGHRYLFGPDSGGRVHHLVAVFDKNGNQIRIDRDATGRILGLVDSAGRPYRVHTDPAGRILGVQVSLDADQRQWLDLARYQYDASGDLCLASDAAGFHAAYRYDNHLMVEHRSVSGLSYCYRYDGRTAEARCIETWGEYIGQVDPALLHPIAPRPQGRDTRKVKGINYVRFTWLPEQHYSEAENGLGGVERFFGDDAGRVVKHIDFAGGVTETVYDEYTGAVAYEIEPDGTRRYPWTDDDGNPLGFTDGSGAGSVVFHQPDGTEVRFVDADESILRRAYDTRGNVVFAQFADGTVEESAYDSRGLLLWNIDRLGVRRTFEHDAMGNCVRTIHPNGDVEISEYDWLGRRIAHIDRQNRRTEWRWDSRNEIVWKRHADGSETSLIIDANRSPTLIDDAGRITRYEFGAMEWLTRMVEPSGAVTDYRYDVEGNLVWVRNPRGQVFTQTFDVANRPVACDTFEGVHMEGGFDAASRPTWVATPDGRRLLAYDPHGPLAEVTEPDDQKTTLQWGRGGATQIDNGVVLIDQEFDRVGQPVRHAQGGLDSLVGWAGGKVSTIASNVGVPVLFAYAVDGQLARIVAGRAAVHLHQANGDDLLTFLGDSLVLRRRYSPIGELVQQTLARRDPSVPLDQAATTGDRNVLWWVSYEYAGPLVLVRERHSDGRLVEYELDPGDQVRTRRAWRGSTLLAEERLAYDAAGSPRVEGARYDAAFRPIEYRGETLEYDAEGRLSRRLTDAGEWRYTWSARHELLRVDAPDHVVEMDYDAFGRRVRKRVFRQNELVAARGYAWANECVLHEVDDADLSSRTYLRPNEDWQPVGHVDVRAGVQSACYYLLDPVGAIDHAVDEDGKVVWRAERTVYGDYTPTVSAVDVDVRFANQSYDADVQLVYNRNRWYDPRLGLYVSPDPLLLEGTPNPRDYVPNPLRFTDPTGLQMPQPPPYGHPQRPPRPAVPAGLDTKYLSGPGHWATNGTTTTPGFATPQPSERTSSKKFSPQTRAVVDAAGAKYGCHSCGRKKPGTKKGHWVPDHQPPATQIRAADKAAGGTAPGAVRLYPQCLRCSRRQGKMMKKQSDRAKQTGTLGPATQQRKVDNANAVMQDNQNHPPTPTHPNYSPPAAPRPTKA